MGNKKTSRVVKITSRNRQAVESRERTAGCGAEGALCQHTGALDKGKGCKKERWRWRTYIYIYIYVYVYYTYIYIYIKYIIYIYVYPVKSPL